MFQVIISEISLATSGSSLAFTLIPTTIVGILSWRWWQRQKAYEGLRSLPSPPKHWLLGNRLQLLAAVKEKKFFQLFFEWSQELGPMYVFWTGSPVLVLSQPKVIEQTIINGMKDGSLARTKQIRAAWNDINGPIMIGQQGTEWQWRRKAWNPEFSASGLSKYIEIINQGCSQVIATIREAKTSEAVPVDPLFIELTMRVISRLVLGVPMDKHISSPEGPPLDTEKVYEAMAVISYRFLRVTTGEKKWQKYLPTQSSRDYWSARKYLESFLSPRVDLALQLRDKQPEELGEISSNFQESMLVKIATKEPKYDYESLIGESVELLLAGTDTTAHTLSFALAELALNSGVCEKARSIVDQVWPSDGVINSEILKELNYIRAIVKETLRLYSIASGSSSLEATRDTLIEGVKVPRGTVITWSILGAGRDPEIYTQPEQFLPERWLEGKGSNSLPLIEFGSGYHRCLGEYLAMLESTIMLTKMLRYFDWELVNGRSSVENLQQNLLIYPADRMPLRFQLRTDNS
jgi:cytochrome P450